MIENPMAEQPDPTWICPLHPFSHFWDDSAVTCSLCGARRTASDAVASLLASQRGWDQTRADCLVQLVRAEVLDETATALTGRHCSPESVALARRLVDERLCPDCSGFGQISISFDVDLDIERDGEAVEVGEIRRCETCNHRGLIPSGTGTSPRPPL
ncbi:hypothetical protein AB0N09_05975 [Streptomyces erythrochromogenes]|uniref:hypothetical protein n=1 Tax=Streptomyces erythrochromogenes TaxID=285574 RepID=UPI0034230A09